VLPIEKRHAPDFAVSGGIIVTFGELKRDTRTGVIDTRDQIIPGLYVASESQGEFFYANYPGATSCLRGYVFGQFPAVRRRNRLDQPDDSRSTTPPVATVSPRVVITGATMDGRC
jgi:hypothetical protein